MAFICFNGRIKQAGVPVFKADNRGYRYGDGLFETIKIREGKILLADLHFERFFAGLALLGIRLPALVTREKVQHEILALCEKNLSSRLGRVRLSVSNGHGGLFETDQPADYLIESWPLDDSMDQFNENGLVCDIFPGGRKSADPFSHLKSSSFQLYAIAARYAREMQLNDCLILNNHERVADTTIANIFILKGSNWLTPPLGEACVAGVMRQYLLGAMKEAGYPITETPISPGDLLQAEEVFLTNAIRGIRWVSMIGNTRYDHPETQEIYNRFFRTMTT